jgi:hypothetical protein
MVPTYVLEVDWRRAALSSELKFFISQAEYQPQTFNPPLPGGIALKYGLDAEETTQLITMVNITKRMLVLKPVSLLPPAPPMSSCHTDYHCHRK